jgi:hypothetical protein
MTNATTWVTKSTFDIERHMQTLADGGALDEIEALLDGTVVVEDVEDADTVIARLRSKY